MVRAFERIAELKLIGDHARECLRVADERIDVAALDDLHQAEEKRRQQYPCAASETSTMRALSVDFSRAIVCAGRGCSLVHDLARPGDADRGRIRATAASSSRACSYTTGRGSANRIAVDSCRFSSPSADIAMTFCRKAASSRGSLRFSSACSLRLATLTRSRDRACAARDVQMP